MGFPQPDLLAGASWSCGASPPGTVTGPEKLAGSIPEWFPATVPGTVAGALGAAGLEVSSAELEGLDWWFRCEFTAESVHAPCLLAFDGIATVADCWLNGAHVLRSENMFVGHDVLLHSIESTNTLVIRCEALQPLLELRKSRPRWRSGLSNQQNLRWYRTTMLGRSPGWTVTPPPVGPWRDVTLRPILGPRVVRRTVRAGAAPGGAGGELTLSLDLANLGSAAVEPLLAVTRHRSADADLAAESTVAPRLEVVARSVTVAGNEAHVELTARLDGIERWWPHTHGKQPLYDVELVLDGERLPLGTVGFRTVTLDRSDGGFRLAVNDVPIFCRGAAWFPPDAVTFAAPRDDVAATLELARAANCNMLRVPGGTVYPDEQFFDLCDQLGILVWQDCMLAFMDPPDDEAFTAEIESELTEVFSGLARHPSVAVICGAQEVEEQAAMFGLSAEARTFPVLDATIPRLAEQILPDLPFVTSSPTGGDPPFRVDSGVSHYFGVGTYLRPLSDARLAGVRFMSEGLAFAVPPEPDTLAEISGGASNLGHDPKWKQAIHHDTGKAFDLEDTRDYYARELFGIDPTELRYLDPERAIDLGRAVPAEILRGVLGLWRTMPQCGGALLIALRDLRRGAGWGVIDAAGRPKSTWYVLRELFAPIAAVFVDEGLNGLRLHVVNDTPEPLDGRLAVELFADGETLVDSTDGALAVAARSSQAFDCFELFEVFHDLSYSYRFGPLSLDVVHATVRSADERILAEATYLPGGPRRDRERDLGLEALASPVGAGRWSLHVATARFAQYVAVDCPGFLADRSWFHLAPGHSCDIGLVQVGTREVPRGTVRALNAVHDARIATSN